MTRSGILVPTCASGPSTICGPTRLVLHRPGRLQACRHPLASQAIGQHHRPAVGNPFVLDGARSRQRMGQLRPCPIPGRDRSDVLAPGTTTASSRRSRRAVRPDGSSTGSGGSGGCKRNGHNRWELPEDEKFQQKRKIKTGLGSGWRYSTFCKTQYASRCRVRRHPQFRPLPPVRHPPARPDRPTADDEGRDRRRGQVRAVSYYTDDPWAEERVYTWHDGKYDVKALVEEVGEWNEMIAATFGAINDMLKASGSPLGLGIADLSVPRLRAS